MKGRMLRKAVLATTMLLLPTLICANTPPDAAQKKKILKKAYLMQIPFIENRGQIGNKDVSFYAKTFGGTVFVEKDGTLTYNLPVEDKGGIVIKEIFTDKKVELKGLEPSPTKTNYFKGKDKNKWKSNLPIYNSISLGEVYEGIDLTLKAYGNNVEKIFTVQPRENPGRIKVKLEGAKGLILNGKGELVVFTELAPINFTKPFAYQEIKGHKTPVDVKYTIFEDNTYGFIVGNYDNKKPLLIDPLLASTFIGGNAFDYGYSLVLDSSGDVFITGSTPSPDYPTTAGAYDENPQW